MRRVFAILIIICFCSCQRNDQAPIIVGVNPWPGYEALYVAKSRGYFSASGLKVKLVEFPSLGDARRAFERGQIDVVASTIVELVISRHQSARKATAIYAIDYSNGSDMLLAKKPITDVAQLKGKKISAEPGTVDVLSLFYALQSVGMNFSDVSVIGLSQLEAEQAFLRGEVQAVQAYPPVALNLLRHGANRLFDTTKAKGKIVDILFADASVVESRTSELKLLISGFAKAQELIVTKDQDALREITNRQNVSVSELELALSGIDFIGKAEQLSFLSDRGLLQVAIENAQLALLSTGYLDNKINIHGAVSAAAIDE